MAAPTTQLLKAILDAFNAHDIDAVMGFFADDCVLEMPRGPDPWGHRLVGAAAVRLGLKSRFDGIPDVHYREDTHYIAGNTGISKWTLSGTATASGARIEVHGCDFYEFRSGVVVRKDSYWKIVESLGLFLNRRRATLCAMRRVRPIQCRQIRPIPRA